MSQNPNRQAQRVIDPEILKAMMQSNQPQAPTAGFVHQHGVPSPCPTVQGVSFQVGDKVGFYSTGGLTTFEAEALKLVAVLLPRAADENDVLAVPAVAVGILKETLARCREVQDPYQGVQKPEQDRPNCAE